MNVAELRAQLEEEMAWRIEEVLFFQNQCSSLPTEEKQDKFRRALVLLLYSNFEGFCKFALNLYLSAINAEDIECRHASYAIAAASLSDVFYALRDSNAKAKEFKSELPDDTKLHRFARDREFIERASEVMSRKVNIPDSVVDMESNLKPIVLRKNLYRLGLPYEQFSHLETDIGMLLNVRNKIAHGETKAGVKGKVYDNLRDSAFRVMNGVVLEITKAASEKLFLAP